MSDDTGTDTGTDADDTGATIPDNPDDAAERAYIDALDALESLDTEDDPVAAVREEKAIMDDFAERIAAARRGGLSESHVSAYAKKLHEYADIYSKTEIIDHVDDTYDKQMSSAGAGGTQQTYPPLDQWLQANLERLTVVRTTDHKQETLYRWQFSSGTAETSDSRNGVTHFSWAQLRDELYQATGENTTKPTCPEQEAWRNWIAGFIDSHAEYEDVVGSRTHAVERLESWIADNVGYTDLSDAVERNGVLVNADIPATDGGDTDDTDDTSADTSADATVSKVKVLWPDIERLLDETSVSARGLQTELDSRGYLDADTSGASDTLDDENETRVWVLDPAIATPARVTDAPETPAEQSDDTDTDTDDDTGNDTDDTGGDTTDNTPDDKRDADGGNGHIGSLGGEPALGDFETDDTDDTGNDTPDAGGGE